MAADASVHDVEEVLAFGKGPPDLWFAYADWLAHILQNAEMAPCLSITVAANRHYDVGLLLAYLLTRPDTREDIRPIIEHDQWYDFPGNQFLSRVRMDVSGLHCVLFFEGTTDRLIAYADASDFTWELAAYHQLGGKQDVENVLNPPDADVVAKLTEMFASVKPFVTTEREIGGVVQSMLEQETSEIAAMSGDGVVLVRLEEVVQLAM